MDLAYGRTRTIVKFTMLEFIARVPYQAWERMSYLALARYRGRSALARRVFARIVESRADQDNEQWHLLILQDLVQRRGLRQSFLLHRLAPWLIAFFYYHVSWLLFVIRPEWSYRLNADFEDHAEHEYMAYVAEHPELETQPTPALTPPSTASTGAWPTCSARSATTSAPTSWTASPTCAPRVPTRPLQPRKPARPGDSRPPDPARRPRGPRAPPARTIRTILTSGPSRPSRATYGCGNLHILSCTLPHP